jgi:hypothetical protein
MKANIYANFEEILDHEITVPSPVDLVIDYEIPEYLKGFPKIGTTVIFATIQPEGHFNKLIIDNQDRFDYLLTFIPELLHLPKARFFIGLTAFCKPEINIPKIFGVSAVFSARNACPGHSLRHELYKRRDEIKVPKWFYTGARTGMRSELELGYDKRDKQRAMRTMFHIAIDSYDYPNSFSEKLIDPMITNTVPIYWGASNVDNFFNPEGILKFTSVDELIKICNSLEERDYYKCQLSRLENYVKAIEYHDYADCIQREINAIFNENA